MVGQKPYEPEDEGIDEVDPNMERKAVASS